MFLFVFLLNSTCKRAQSADASSRIDKHQTLALVLSFGEMKNTADFSWLDLKRRIQSISQIVLHAANLCKHVYQISCFIVENIFVFILFSKIYWLYGKGIDQIYSMTSGVGNSFYC